LPTTSAASRPRTVAWSKGDPFGAEIAVLERAGDRLKAEGVAIGSDPEPYRLEYSLETGARFITTKVIVTSTGDGWSRKLDLRREPGSGGWSAEVEQHGEVDMPDAGGDLATFDCRDGSVGALDPDLGLSPLFNSMPVLRHGLHEGGKANDFLMVWISVPDLSLHPSPQRYTHLETTLAGEHVVRFEAVGDGEDFVADVLFDDDGVVLDYPGIATLLGRHAKD
jgi:hypothetical protein